MWRNEKGQACTDRTPVQVESASEDSDQHEACMMREDLEQDCQSLEDFLRVKQEARIPSLDSRDNPFDNQHLYWPKPHENGENGQTQAGVK